MKKAELEAENAKLREEVENLNKAVTHQEFLLNDLRTTVAAQKRRADLDGFDVFKGADGKEWFWHFQAANGEIIAQSEAYTRKADAERGAKDALAAFGAQADDAQEASAQPEDEGEQRPC